MSTHHESTDEEIVARVTGGDVDAYAELMQRYEHKLIRYVTYLIHDATAAVDIVQETFIKAYQNLHGFNTKLKFSSWIYRIAHNEAMNAVKKDRHINHQLDVENIREASYESGVAQDIDRKILQADVQACIDQLESKYRDIVILQYYEHMKYREIADVLHMPVSTVGVRAARGRTQLRHVCEQKGVLYE